MASLTQIAIGRIDGANVQCRQRNARYSRIRFAAGAIDDRRGCNHLGSGVAQGFDRFARRASSGNDIFDDQYTLAFANAKAAAQSHPATLAFSPNKPHAKLPRHLVTNHYAADCRRSNGFDSFAAKLFGDCRAELRRHRRRLQRDRALQVDRAVKAAGQNEVAFEQRTGAFEPFDYFARVHRFKNFTQRLQCTSMVVPPNLISDSTLVQETFDLISASGGRAAFTEIADAVLRLSHVGEELSALLVADLIRHDPRFRIEAAHLAIVDDDTELRPLNEIDFVVLDVEAIVTRTKTARIIELGAYRVRGGQIIGDFQTLINPEARLPRFIATMTGISDEMLAAAPKFTEIVGAWLDFAGDAVLAAHNSSFDLPLLNREIARVFPGYGLGNHELCTVNLARRLVSNSDGYNLDALADHFGIENPERHRAAGDALTTARILLRLLDQLAAGGVRTLAEARTFRADAETPGAELDLQLTLDI